MPSINISYDFFNGYQKNFNSWVKIDSRIVAIVTTALCCLAASYYAIRHYFKLKKSNIQEKELNKEIENKNQSLQKISIEDEGTSFYYLDKKNVQRTNKFIPKEIYAQIVNQLPICCVDVLVYNKDARKYFLVLRKDPPAQGVWWLIGGRLNKGQSLPECAREKCEKEAGFKKVTIVEPPLGLGATFFPNSAWDTQTHTVNTIFLAIVDNSQALPKIDKTCADYKWESIDSVPEDPYVAAAYHKALKIIKADHI